MLATKRSAATSAARAAWCAQLWALGLFTACAEPQAVSPDGSEEPAVDEPDAAADNTLDASAPMRDAAPARALETGAEPSDATPSLDAHGSVPRDAESPTRPLPVDAAPPVPDAAATADARVPGLDPPVIFLAGDSTVASYKDSGNERDQAGWGQMLGAQFSERVRIDNRAVGGATARHFLDDGRLDQLLKVARPDDVLLVQFGTNDGNKTATYELNGVTIPYYADPATTFRTQLKTYVERARAASVRPAFVTPPPRNSAYCVGGNSTGAHAQAMRELGAELGVPVIDLNAKTVAHLKAICPSPTPENFFLLRPDGSVDGTHFQKNGARTLAGFVADAFPDDLGLADYVRKAGP